MRYRHLIIGAGRIGAGFQWGDLGYTHAGASRALSDRVELVGFVEPDPERAVSAKLKWQVPVYENLGAAYNALRPDVVSVCVQPEKQAEVMYDIEHFYVLKAIWCEKPLVSRVPKNVPVQVNYMRRGDPWHRELKADRIIAGDTLIVYGKDDIHTRCHFEDLRDWWNVELDYRVFNGPCAYVLRTILKDYFFDQGGVDGAECFKAMLGNLLDHVEGKAALWSPANG